MRLGPVVLVVLLCALPGLARAESGPAIGVGVDLHVPGDALVTPAPSTAGTTRYEVVGHGAMIVSLVGRARLPISGPVYIAFLAETGQAVEPGLGSVGMGTSRGRSGPAPAFFGGGATLGGRATVDHFELYGELYFGFVAIASAVASTDVSVHGGLGPTGVDYILHGVIEPRVGAAYWVGSNVTIGMSAGVDLIGPFDEFVFGVDVAYHTEPLSSPAPE